jgi:hypothetical protein
MFEKVFRIIFVSMKEGITGEWRKLGKELHNIFIVITSRHS